jgi:hypothetical protein
MRSDEMPRLLRSVLPYVAILAIVFGVANFAWFWWEGFDKGVAATGRIVDGHYFLNNRWAGTYTEVSRQAWDWSVFHGASIAATHALAIAGIAYLLFQFEFPARMGLRTNGEEAVRIAAIRSSGDRLALGRGSGWIGGVSFAGPLLVVEVYPGGIVVRPIFMAARAIPVTTMNGTKVLGDSVIVDHSGAGAPLIVRAGPDDSVGRALRSLRPPTSEGMLEPNIERRARLLLENYVGVSVDARSENLTRGLSGLPPGIAAVGFLLGTFVSVSMIVFGITWAIPKLGLGGVVWTAFAIGMTVVNLRRFVPKHWLRRR